MRLQYDEAKKQVDSLQQELIQIDDQMVPGQNESDKDRYSNVCAGVSNFPHFTGTKYYAVHLKSPWNSGK